MSPARPGVDERKKDKLTSFGADENLIEVYMGDKNEVMLKKPNVIDHWHRRWYPDGWREIVKNLKAITEANAGLPRPAYYIIRDNKDRNTVLWIDHKQWLFADSVEDAVEGKAEVALDFDKLWRAVQKAMK